MKEAGIAYMNWGLNEYTIIDINIGNQGSVEFDFLKIKDKLKYYKRNSASKGFLTFVHSHPLGIGAELSPTDVNCVKGFMQGFGLYRILFNVIDFKKDEFGLHDCVQKQVNDKTRIASAFTNIEDAVFLNYIPKQYVDMIKLLSYIDEDGSYFEDYLYLLENN